MRGTKFSGIVAALALVLTACGGDDDDAESAATSAAEPTTPATSPETTPATTPGTAADPTGPATGSAPDTSVPTFAGDPDSEFCVTARAMDDIGSEPENPFDNTFYEEMVATMSPMYDDFVATAPPEIADAAAVEAEAFAGLAAAFAAVDFQFLDLDLSAVPQGPEITAAKARVDGYLQQVCGIERDSDDGPPPGEGTVRELLADQFVSSGATAEQADCMVDFIATAPEGSDMQLGLGVMGTCGFTQPLIDAGFTADEAACTVDFLSDADVAGELDGDEIEMGIALVAACGITQPLIDAGFTADEADCVVETLAAETEIDAEQTAELGLTVINACGITRFFTERGFTEEQATCMLAELAEAEDMSDEDAVVDAVVAACVTDVSVAPTTTA